MDTREAYKQKMEARLKEWGAQINLLAAQAASAGADAKLKYAQDLDKLRDKQRQATEKLKELEEASGDAWEKVKTSADTLWDDLKSGVAHTMGKFK
jgi:hypothetical protein